MHSNTTPEELLFKLVENEHYLPQKDNIFFLKHLLANHYLNINAKNSRGLTALMVAINKRAPLEVLTLLLNAGTDLSTTDTFERNVLHYAVEKSNKAFLEACFNSAYKEQIKKIINHKDHKGRTLLLLANEICDLDVIQLLLQKKDELDIHLNEKNNEGNTAIYVAFLTEYHIPVLRLAQAGADLVVNKNTSDQTMLHLYLDVDILEPLITELSDAQTKKYINNQDINGRTVLAKTCELGEEDTVSFLLQRKNTLDIDLNSTDQEGNTALHLALLNNHPHIALQLIGKGADTTIINKKNENAILLAAFKGYKNIVEHLIAKNTDLNCQNSDGNTALHLAIQQSHVSPNYEIALLLIEANADANIPNHQHKSAFDLASAKSNVPMIRNMITKKLPQGNLPETWVNHPQTRCLLIKFIQNGEKKQNLSLFKSLLEAKVSVHSLDSESTSPLHEAAKSGHCTILKYLLDGKANIDLRKNGGSTPLIEACMNKHINAISLLLEAGADPMQKSHDNKYPIEYLPEGHESRNLLIKYSVNRVFPSWFTQSLPSCEPLPPSPPLLLNENEASDSKMTLTKHSCIIK